VRILHFISGRGVERAATVASAIAPRGWEQTLVVAAAEASGTPDAFPGAVAGLVVGTGSATEQSAAAMVGFERILVEGEPDFVLVYQNDDLTLAASLAAAKLGAAIVRVESGLRTDDRAAETNRTLIDRLASLLFTPSDSAEDSLSAEGIDPGCVRRVGPIDGDADAAQRMADHLEAEARPGDAPWPRTGRDLKGQALERIIEAQI
jgi:UDP-N-acetylglucosamine 2-epimerase (non-hydrolysing)